jgi:PTH2 family peptidyl-tRNA hydrolase
MILGKRHFKQVIVVRDDIDMSLGKMCVQCCHASLGSAKEAKNSVTKKWEEEGAKKVVLKIESEKELKNLYKKAKSEKTPCFLVKDAGLTQLQPGTTTCLGIGPAEEKKIDEITGKLKLL